MGMQCLEVRSGNGSSWLAALSFHPATASKVQTFGEEELCSEQPSSLPSRSSCFNHLKPEDVRLLLRSACHINKTDTLHLQNQHQKNPEEAAREGGTVWLSKRRTSENLSFCKYQYNLQTISLELCHFTWWRWNIRSSNSWERSWGVGERNKWGKYSQKWVRSESVKMI